MPGTVHFIFSEVSEAWRRNLFCLVIQLLCERYATVTCKKCYKHDIVLPVVYTVMLSIYNLGERLACLKYFGNISRIFQCQFTGNNVCVTRHRMGMPPRFLPWMNSDLKTSYLGTFGCGIF